MGDSKSHQWKEKEWENYVNQLLSFHHSVLGDSYQPIPDYGGDRGLEGCTNKGEAYQAYADQDSKNNKERTRKQKNKIRDDLKKFETYCDFWKEFFVESRLKHWTLMVPSLDDKEVVKYAKTQARKLVGKNLSFVDDTFFADVKTANEFPVAQAAIRIPSLPNLNSVVIEDSDIDDYKVAEPVFVANLKLKLKKVNADATENEIDSNVSKWLRWHLVSCNLLESLKAFPTLWEMLDELIYVTGQSIETENLYESRQPAQRLRESRAEFESKLMSDEIGFLSSANAINVSNGTIARWLGECPLDFGGDH